jgi:hypothetical protein
MRRRWNDGIPDAVAELGLVFQLSPTLGTKLSLVVAAQP